MRPVLGSMGAQIRRLFLVGGVLVTAALCATPAGALGLFDVASKPPPDTTSGMHPRLVTPDVPWHVAIPASDMLVYVHAGGHLPARFHISVVVDGGETSLLSLMSSNSHMVHALDVPFRFRHIVVEADRPMYLAFVPRISYSEVADPALHFECWATQQAVLWTPPPSTRLLLDGRGVAPGVVVYGQPDHYVMSAVGPGPVEGRREPLDDAYWVVTAGGDPECNGQMRVAAEQSPLAERSALPLGGFVAGLALFGAVGALPVPEPRIPRRRGE